MAEDAQRRRGERILDAAAELVLRWGYQRVTVEQVAQRAGVGKGTVYLHFESRAWLFACVLMRESLDLVDELTAAIRRDAAAVLPAEQVRLTYLAVQRRPLLRAVFARDGDLLGELARDGAVEPLRDGKGALAREQFRVLRERGLVRTDLDLDTQRYLVEAVQTGFYLHRPALAPEAAAAALHHAVRAAVQPPGDPDPDALTAVAPAVLASHERLRASVAAAIAARPVPPPERGRR